jgi:hypothetical protein
VLRASVPEVGSQEAARQPDIGTFQGCLRPGIWFSGHEVFKITG